MNATIPGVPDALTRGVPNPVGLGVVGSTAYGMARPDSDRDRLGVYVEPTDRFLGLDPPTRNAATVVRHLDEGDVQWHEIGKFAALALGGNPTINELLWLPDELIEHREWPFLELRRLRPRMLSRRTIEDSYLGFAASQASKLASTTATPQRVEKAARHLLRLIDQGLHAYRTGDVRVAVDDPERYFDFGRRVLDDRNLAFLALDEARRDFAETDSPLPETADRGAVNEALVRIRRDYFEGR